jgi:hypothetical protein
VREVGERLLGTPGSLEHPSKGELGGERIAVLGAAPLNSSLKRASQHDDRLVQLPCVGQGVRGIVHDPGGHPTVGTEDPLRPADAAVTGGDDGFLIGRTEVLLGTAINVLQPPSLHRSPSEELTSEWVESRHAENRKPICSAAGDPDAMRRRAERGDGGPTLRAWQTLA